jgi:hypothetical protein
MISLKSILSFFVLLVCLGTLTVAKKEEEDSALRDLQIGMQGLKEAASNPALMAQLMRDLAVRVLYIIVDVSPHVVAGRRRTYRLGVISCFLFFSPDRLLSGPGNDDGSTENDGQSRVSETNEKTHWR